MLNKFDFPEAPQILGRATKAAWCMIFAECSAERSKGSQIAGLLRPEEDDCFILKPKHSGFYQTALELLLADLGVGHLILTGIAGNICVLFTAHDAHIRNFDVTVVNDCIASNSIKDDALALYQIKDVLRLSATASQSI